MNEIIINGVIYHAHINASKHPTDEAKVAICDLVREHERHHHIHFQGDIRITSNGLHTQQTFTHNFQLSAPTKERHSVDTATDLFAKIVGMPTPVHAPTQTPTLPPTTSAEKIAKPIAKPSAAPTPSTPVEKNTVSDTNTEFSAKATEERPLERSRAPVERVPGEYPLRGRPAREQQIAFQALAANPRDPKYTALREYLVEIREGRRPTFSEDRYIQDISVYALFDYARQLAQQCNTIAQ